VADDRPVTALYLAEVYTPRPTAAEEEAQRDRVRAAAEALAADGPHVRYVQVLLVPGEETAFHLFEAEGPAAVEAVLRAAGLEAERISPALAVAGKARSEAPAVHAV
jgi:acetyl esterase/lipase